MSGLATKLAPPARGGRAAQEKLVAVMQRLANAGRGTNAELVEAARPKSSPIHDCFTWDDKRAGEKYRLLQAQRYWREFRVEWTVSGKTGQSQLFHVVKDDEGNASRRSIDYVLRTKSAREQVLAAMREDLEAFRRRHDAMRTLAGTGKLFSAIDDFLD